MIAVETWQQAVDALNSEQKKHVNVDSDNINQGYIDIVNIKSVIGYMDPVFFRHLVNEAKSETRFNKVRAFYDCDKYDIRVLQAIDQGFDGVIYSGKNHKYLKTVCDEAGLIWIYEQ